MPIDRGLFIGIDYVGTRNELQNCGNDARDALNALTQEFGVVEHRAMNDRYNGENPTRKNIESALKWLVSDLQPGRKLWLHYSGHGAYKTDTNGDELDGRDETIVPVDYEHNGEIDDDWIHENVVLPVEQAGAVLYWHDDCCHSGSGADLPYTMKCTTENVPTTVIEQYTDYQDTTVEEVVYEPAGPPQQPDPTQYLCYYEYLEDLYWWFRQFVWRDNRSAVSERRCEKCTGFVDCQKLNTVELSEQRRRGFGDWFVNTVSTYTKAYVNSGRFEDDVKKGYNLVSKFFKRREPTRSAETDNKHRHLLRSSRQVVPRRGLSTRRVPVLMERPRTVYTKQRRLVNTRRTQRSLNVRNGSGVCYHLSGCKDDQTSADGYNGGANGAMTGSFLSLRGQWRTLTAGEFLSTIRQNLEAGGFDQIPQLNSSYPLEPNTVLFAGF